MKGKAPTKIDQALQQFDEIDARELLSELAALHIRTMLENKVKDYNYTIKRLKQYGAHHVSDTDAAVRSYGFDVMLKLSHGADLDLRRTIAADLGGYGVTITADAVIFYNSGEVPDLFRISKKWKPLTPEEDDQELELLRVASWGLIQEKELNAIHGHVCRPLLQENVEIILSREELTQWANLKAAK